MGIKFGTFQLSEKIFNQCMCIKIEFKIVKR